MIKMFKAARNTQQLKQPLTKSPAGYRKKIVLAALLKVQPATIQATSSWADQALSLRYLGQSLT